MTDWMALEPHPVADLLPLMDEVSFKELKDDIALNGLREPVWLHPDGRILDGRNRHKACVALRLKPATKVYAGDLSTEAIVAFIISLNLKRRHLDSGQRAFVALRVEQTLAEAARERQVAALNKGQEPGVPLPKDLGNGSDRHKNEVASQAAAMVGTNRQYVADAKKIRQEAPDLEQQVVAGKLSLPKAKQQLKKRQRAKQPRQPQPAAVQVLPEPAHDDQPAAAATDWTQKAIGDVIVWRADSRNLARETTICDVDLVVTSPPYNVGIEYGEHIDRMPQEQYEELLDQVFLACHQVMRDGARIAVVMPFGVGRNPWRPLGLLTATRLQKAGFILRGQIVWDKGSSGNRTSWGSFRSSTDPSLRDTVECILVAHKAHSAAPVPRAVLRQDDKGTHSPWLASSDYFMALAQDHWTVAPESAQRVGHPAPFPLELAQRLLHFYGWPGCTLLDPFGGSGTVGVAAALWRCRAHVVDIDPAYCDLTARRVAAAYEHLRTQEASHG
jgi:DNA modification methylase